MPPTTPFDTRLAAIRRDLRAAGVEALLVTHPPNVRYLTGLAASAGAVIVTPTRCVLLADFRYEAAARELLAGREALAMELVVPPGTLDHAVVDVLREVAAPRVGIEAGSLVVGRFNRLSAALSAVTTPMREASRRPGVSLVPLDGLVEARRIVKDASEIATLREAGKRLAAVAGTLAGLARAGRTEQEVAADIDSALRAAGFERPAFETIVASGPNGARPHARPGQRVLREGDGVVLDFGGVYDGYCVDLTRTLFLGAPAVEMIRIAEAVRDAQAAAIAAVRPGARPSEIDAAARGLLAARGLGEAFGHGTGHGLGLEVHEAPRISKLAAEAADAPVEPGMVFTIEPGAYVEGLGGVRIEDDVIVTPDGCEVLTV